MPALNRIVSHKCGIKFEENKKSMHLQVNREQRASRLAIAPNTKPVVGGNNLLGWHLLYCVGRQRKADNRSMLGPRCPSCTLLYSPMAGSVSWGGPTDGAYLSISCSRASGCSGAPKFSIIQTELTSDVFLKFLKDNYMRVEGTKINIKLDKDNTHHKSDVLHPPFK